TEFRSGSGAPGARYWEQRADYDLRGTLDTASKTLRGEMTLRYTNHSPDTLRYVFFQVEQNAFKDKSLNSFVFPAESRFGARGFEGGDVVEHFDQVREGAAVSGEAPAPPARGPAPARKLGTPLKTRSEGTMIKVGL